MTREEAAQALYAVKDELIERHFEFKGHVSAPITAIDMAIEALSAEAVQGWIPFTRRPMTEEEQKDYPNCTFMFDCVLPDDGDEILVSKGRFVWMDTFCNDIDGCYLDRGDDIDEDMAWMPLPKPYEAVQGWIPCSKRLPEKDGNYLVCMNWDYRNMDVLMWADGWNCIRLIDGSVDRKSEIDGVDILAWMPLPEPYREDGEA